MTLDELTALEGLHARASGASEDAVNALGNPARFAAVLTRAEAAGVLHDRLRPVMAQLLALARRGLEAESAVAEIAAERRRQMEAESWSPEHDDRHTRGELARAASCYAVVGGMGDSTRDHYRPGHPPRSYATGQGWPWDAEWWKPKNRRRDLIRAGALIVAEIERLDRAATRETTP